MRWLCAYGSVSALEILQMVQGKQTHINAAKRAGNAQGRGQGVQVPLNPSSTKNSALSDLRQMCIALLFVLFSFVADRPSPKESPPLVARSWIPPPPGESSTQSKVGQGHMQRAQFGTVFPFGVTITRERHSYCSERITHPYSCVNCHSFTDVIVIHTCSEQT